ncbi:MAG TPA: hypothetical protein VGR96_15710 [Acidobacteriaceae bacterium]|nr:hypothetical protein [Acidobacteriaceae bacterium]
MRFPWISRTSHEEMTALLIEGMHELKEERRVLLDRLALLGLGGALYPTAKMTEPELEEAGPEEAADPGQEALEQLLRLRNRPTKLADALTRQAYRERGKRAGGPKVAWIPQGERTARQESVRAALDEAEAAGREHADAAGARQ